MHSTSGPVLVNATLSDAPPVTLRTGICAAAAETVRGEARRAIGRLYRGQDHQSRRYPYLRAHGATNPAAPRAYSLKGIPVMLLCERTAA